MWVVEGEDVVVKGSHGRRTILHHVNFSLEEKRITLFIGKSGSGKTTLLRSIVGLAPLYSGNITVKDQRKIGFVSQHCDLFPHMTVLRNCTHPQIKINKADRTKAIGCASHFLELLGVRELENEYPESLSGGQKQRVAIARTLSMGNRIVLFDEPTSALDPYATDSFARVIHRLISEGITVAMSVHDMDLAKKCLDRIYLLEEGRIVEEFSGRENKPGPQSKIYSYLNNRDFSDPI